MWAYYDDILDRIDTPPLWFDEQAVPRFAPFAPNLTANIYANEAVLALIACQACGREFQVAFSRTGAAAAATSVSSGGGDRVWLADEIRVGRLHFGDPPNTRCCTAGATMNSVMKRVLEYWYRPMIRGEGVTNDPRGFVRITAIRATEFHKDPSLEIVFPN